MAWDYVITEDGSATITLGDGTRITVTAEVDFGLNILMHVTYEGGTKPLRHQPPPPRFGSATGYDPQGGDRR